MPSRCDGDKREITPNGGPRITADTTHAKVVFFAAQITILVFWLRISSSVRTTLPRRVTDVGTSHRRIDHIRVPHNYAGYFDRKLHMLLREVLHQNALAAEYPAASGMPSLAD